MAAPKKAKKAPAAAPKAAPQDGEGWISYRALSDCRVGHLRREGEVFSWPAFAECPDHLEEVDEDASPEGDAEEKPGVEQGATLADLGLGPAQSAADVTSADMINQ